MLSKLLHGYMRRIGDPMVDDIIKLISIYCAFDDTWDKRSSSKNFLISTKQIILSRPDNHDRWHYPTKQYAFGTRIIHLSKDEVNQEIYKWSLKLCAKNNRSHICFGVGIKHIGYIAVTKQRQSMQQIDFEKISEKNYNTYHDEKIFIGLECCTLYEYKLCRGSCCSGYKQKRRKYTKGHSINDTKQIKKLARAKSQFPTFETNDVLTVIVDGTNKTLIVSRSGYRKKFTKKLDQLIDGKYTLFVWLRRGRDSVRFL